METRVLKETYLFKRLSDAEWDWMQEAIGQGLTATEAILELRPGLFGLDWSMSKDGRFTVRLEEER